MVGACQLLLVALATDQFMGAVLADVVEGFDRAIGGLDAEQLLFGNFQREIVANLGQLRDMTGELPAARQQALTLAGIDGRVGVIPTFERADRLDSLCCLCRFHADQPLSSQ